MADETIDSLVIKVASDAQRAENGIRSAAGALKELRASIPTNAQVERLNALSVSLRKVSSASRAASGAAITIRSLASAMDAFKGASGPSKSAAANIGAIIDKAKGLSSEGAQAVGSLGGALSKFSGVKLSKTVASNFSALVDTFQRYKSMDFGAFSRQIDSLTASLNRFGKSLSTVGAGYGTLPRSMRSGGAAARTVGSANFWTGNLAGLTKNGKSFAGGGVGGNQSTTASNFAGGLGGMRDSFTGVLGPAAMFQGALAGIGAAIAKCVNLSNNYIEDMNLFQASMGQYTQEATDFGKTVQDLMGIDFSSWARNQGVFQTLITGMGLAADKADVMSKQLTQLGYDISSFYNIPVDDAMLKIQSGVSGELEPMRRLGYDLSDARMQLEATNLGIDKSVQEMTQAEKVALRYYMIMSQVTQVHGDMARTIASPANQLRVLQAQVTMAARSIGDLLIPVLNAVLPYLIAVAKAVRIVAQEIASFLGVDATFDVDYGNVDYSGMSDGLQDNADAAEDDADALDDATQKAEEYKNTVMGFDELNKLNDPTGGSDGSSKNKNKKKGGGDLGGIDVPMPTYDFLDGLDDYITKLTDGMAKKLAAALPDIIRFGGMLAKALDLGPIKRFVGELERVPEETKLLPGHVETMRERIAKAMEPLADKARSVRESVVSKFRGVGDDIAAKFKGLKEKVAPDFDLKGVRDAMVSGFSGAKDAIAAKFGGAGAAIASKFSGVAEAVKPFLAEIKMPDIKAPDAEALSAPFKAAKTVIEASMAPIRGIKSIIEGSADALARVGEAVSKIPGVGTVFKFLGPISDIFSLFDLFNKLPGVLDNNARGMANAGDTVKDLALDFGGLGMTVGSVFGPVGTLVGGAVGAAVGAIVGGWNQVKDLPVLSTVGEVCSQLKGPMSDAATTVGGALTGIATAGDDCVKHVDPLAGVSEDVAQRFGTSLDSMEGATSKLSEIDFSDAVVTDSDVQDIASKIADVHDTILNNLDSERNADLAQLDPLAGMVGASDEELQSWKDKINDYYDGQKADADGYQQQIYQIYSTAASQHRTLTDDECSQVKQIQQKMQDELIQSSGATSDQMQQIQSAMDQNNEQAALSSASNILQTAAQTRDQQVATAWDNYNQQVEAAGHLRDAGAISDEEYQAMVDAAAASRDSQVQAANDTYYGPDGVVAKVQSGLGDSADKMDYETGEIKSNWQVFCDDMGSKWSGFCSDVSSWVENKVKPTLRSMKNWCKKVGDSVKDSLSYPVDVIKDRWRDVKNWFHDHVISPLEKAFDNIRLSIPSPKLPHIKWHWHNWFGGFGNFSIPMFDGIDWYARGGFPEHGQLFMANEAGPELVGTMGGRTAVANNDQIVAGIERGVISAMTQVLSQRGAGDGGDVVLVVGSTELARASLKGLRTMGARGELKMDFA